MKLLRWSVLSAGISRQSPALEQSLKFIPCTCAVGELEAAVKLSAKLSYDPIPMCVLLHAYDFLDYRSRTGSIRIADFEKMIARLKNNMNIRFCNISQAASVLDDVGAQRLELNIRLTARLRRHYFRVPNFLKRILPLNTYLPANGYSMKNRWALCVLTGLYYLCLAALVLSIFWIRIPLSQSS
jgi:hypothetical protein